LIEEAHNITLKETTPIVMEEDLNLEGKGTFISKIDMIADSQWEERMSLYNYSQHQRKCVQTSLIKKQEFFSFKDHSEWKSLISDPKQDI
jgi:hypothetical protein